MFRNKLSLRSREAVTGIAFAALPLMGFAIFYIVPFGITVARTFSSGTAGFIFVGFNTYISVLNSTAFRLAAGNTFKFIGLGVPLILTLSMGTALLLNTRLKGGRRLNGVDAFRAAYVLPLILPAATVVLVFQILFTNGGVFNYALDKLGLGTVNFLNSGNVFWVMILLYLWKNMGYCIILLLAGLVQIPEDYYESAGLEGAGTFIILRKITLPLMGPTFFFVTLIAIVGSFKSFREAFALGGNYPHESMYMLQHFMNNNFANLNYSRLSVAAVLTFSVIFVFVLVMYLRRGRVGAE